MLKNVSCASTCQQGAANTWWCHYDLCVGKSAMFVPKVLQLLSQRQLCCPKTQPLACRRQQTTVRLPHPQRSNRSLGMALPLGNKSEPLRMLVSSLGHQEPAAQQRGHGQWLWPNQPLVIHRIVTRTSQHTSIISSKTWEHSNSWYFLRMFTSSRHSQLPIQLWPAARLVVSSKQTLIEIESRRAGP